MARVKTRKPTPRKRSSAYADLIQQRQTEIPRLVKSLLASARNGSKEAQQALQLLNAATMQSVMELVGDMNVKAVLHLLALLQNTLGDFEDQWRSQPKFYQIWARNSAAWPCLLPRRKPEFEDLRKFLFKKSEPDTLRLELGMDHSLNLAGKSFDTDTVGAKVALHLYYGLEHFDQMPPPMHDELGAIRAGLSPLSRQLLEDAKARSGKSIKRTVAQEWWDAAEPIFHQLYGEDFENHSIFIGYQQNAAFRGLSAADRRNQIRTAIKADIAQGFYSIAQKLPKKKLPKKLPKKKA